MTAFARLRNEFHVTWTTVLVGWIGVGVLSPWPHRWEEFPPLLSTAEVFAFAEEQLGSCLDARTFNLVVDVLSLDATMASRAELRNHLSRLADAEMVDRAVDLRKWRWVLLVQRLDTLPSDPVYGLAALTEFWQDFGFPSDSPHEVQGRGNRIAPSDYYQADNFRKILDRHRAWIERERIALHGANGSANGSA